MAFNSLASPQQFSLQRRMIGIVQCAETAIWQFNQM
jgi:hypothetical protein